ncbi:MAG: serine/threonine-protein kinase [Pirellulaceae bacterium]
MADITSETLAQRILESRLLESRQIEESLMAVGGRGADAADFERELLQRELLTNWQIQRLREGHRRGYFYGNWRILYMVGHGTFARVYRAVHVKTGDVKAVKVLRNRYSDDEIARERFLQEAKTVMELRHPNIVPIHEVDTDRGRIFMVMDFVEGQNLRDYVRAQGKLKLVTALTITRDLASGLDYAMKRGITHRDMKLSNVLLSSKGQAKLVDFGLATVNADGDDDSKQGPRSIDYAGLEKMTNVRRNDPRSDIFFLGCMLYHMLAGEPAMKETRERMKRMSPQRFREIAPIAAHLPSLPHRVVIFINRMMDLNPESRIQNTTQALKEAQTVLDAVTSGDLEALSPEVTQQQMDDYAAMLSAQDEGKNRTVLLVESEPKMQDMFREKLKAVGYRVLIMGNALRAMERFTGLDPAENVPADCVVLGTAGLGQSAVDTFRKFRGGRLDEIPVVLLLDPKRSAMMDDLSDIAPNRVVLQLPQKMKEIRKVLKDLFEQAEQEQGSVSE